MDMSAIGDSVAVFTRLWGELATKMMTAGLSFNPLSPPPVNAERFRQAFLDGLSEYADQFMRSPPFLEFMKQSMDSAMNFRGQVDEAFTAMRHDTQGTAREDIDSLLLSVRRLGSRLTERLDEMESRFDQIDQKFEMIHGNGHAPVPNGKSGSRRGPSGTHATRPMRPVAKRSK